METDSTHDIPAEELAAVSNYIATEFARVDPALRTRDPALLRELDAFIQMITDGLYGLPSYRGVVYRGATLSDDVARQYVPGTVLFERSFVSATADPARRYPGNATFVIASITGRDVSSLSAVQDEQEVLFFSGTWFKVLATEHDAVAGELYIYLAEIPDRRMMDPGDR